MKANDQAIFVHKSNYSSSSLLITFYTKSKGLQKFIFKGGKKKAHNLFPLAISEIEYFGRNTDLLTLIRAEQVHPQTILFDPVKSSIAFFMAEVIQKCAEPGDCDEALFNFLERSILSLEKDQQLSIFPIEFLLHLTALLGFAPLVEENECSVFNLDAGTFQHTESKQHRTYKGKAVRFILQLLKEENVNVPTKDIREESMVILLNYYSIHVPRFKQLSSFEILKEVLS